MSAVFSHCGKHRLRLDREVKFDLDLLLPGRIFDEDARLVFCGINPSTAAEVKNDPTIRKITGFCQRWGFGRFTMVNVYTYVSTDVKQLAKMDPLDIVTRNHLKVLEEALDNSDGVVPCWGSRSKLPKALHNGLDNRLDFLLAHRRHTGVQVYHMGIGVTGDPYHPLMLPYSTPLTEWAQ